MIGSIGIRELRDLSSQLSEKAAAGDSFFLTKNGAALYYAIPVDQTLMDQGSRFAAALNLYKNEALTIGQAAKLAELSVEEFMIEAGKAGFSVIDYDDDIPDSDMSI
ncbi:MAG: UPF0175 family protein [Pseudomonadales bacterium]